MKIGVIGVGVVGGAVLRAFSLKFETVGYDIVGEHSGAHRFQEILACDLVFVCVPSLTINGVQDRQPVIATCESLANAGYQGVVCLKSTVVPGTTREMQQRFGLRMVHNPEFLTAARPFDDFMEQKSVLVTGATDDCALVVGAYRELLPETPSYVSKDWEVSEIAKYMRNVYLAMKVAYSNEIFDLCGHAKVDYNDVLKAMLAQGAIEGGHFRVPGPDSKRGFSGACFPKDVRALARHMEANKLNARLVRAVDMSNQVVRPHGDRCQEIGGPELPPM